MLRMDFGNVADFSVLAKHFKTMQIWYYDYLYTNMTSLWGVHQENPKSRFVFFFPFCVLHFVRYNKTNLTCCGVYTRNNFPERGLSLEGVAREDCRPWATPSSENHLSGKLFLVYTPQGFHICFIIPNKMQKHKRGKNHEQRLWIYLVNTPQGCHICVIIPNKMQKHERGIIYNRDFR